MGNGGYRLSGGPLPDAGSSRQDRLRSSVAGGWVDLPAEGRQGDAPAWPLRPYRAVRGQDPGAIAASEQWHWSALWKLPQAVAWEQLGWTRDIALYCRLMALAEGGQISAAGEARQWSDRLGLSAPALARLRWRIRPNGPVPAPLGSRTPRPRRLRAVEGQGKDA